MAEYIEREAAINAIRLWRGEISVDMAVAEIQAVSAEDVAPVVHGQWIEVTKIAGVDVLKCSACGKEHPMLPSAFCRDCGAKMREA